MSKTAKANEKIVSREKWSKHFGKWFRKVLIDGKILDYRYPIKGAGSLATLRIQNTRKRISSHP